MPYTKWMPFIKRINLQSIMVNAELKSSKCFLMNSLECFSFYVNLFVMIPFNSSTVRHFWDITSGLIEPQRALSHDDKIKFSIRPSKLVQTCRPNDLEIFHWGIPLWYVPYAKVHHPAENGMHTISPTHLNFGISWVRNI